MKKIISVFILAVCFWGCTNESLVRVDIQNKGGTVSLKINPDDVPAGVEVISLQLTRIGYDDIIADIHLSGNSPANLQFNDIPYGIWHLNINGKTGRNVILYSSETEITFIKNEVSHLNLTLYPVLSRTGGVKMKVSWDTWKDYLNNAILTRYNNPSNPWDVRMSKVIYDNGLYKMWYTCVYDHGITNIWYAESPDGIKWKTIGRNPVLDKGDYLSWDSYGVTIASVLKEGDTYKMYYIGQHTHPYHGEWNIGYATSCDGINWEKTPEPIICTDDKYYFLGVSDVIKKNNKYYMYFGYSSPTEPAKKIGLATSYDGITWMMSSSNPIITANMEWEKGGIGNPSVVYENDEFKMVYENSSVQNAFGMAVSSDGEKFIKNALPIFKNSNTQKNWVRISYPFLRKFNDGYRIYYTGENNDRPSICFAFKRLN